MTATETQDFIDEDITDHAAGSDPYMK